MDINQKEPNNNIEKFMMNIKTTMSFGEKSSYKKEKIEEKIEEAIKDNNIKENKETTSTSQIIENYYETEEKKIVEKEDKNIINKKSNSWFGFSFSN